MKFEDAVLIILEHEGGYVNHPKDPGGETNYGISKRAYPKLNIRAITKEQAIEIYRTDYWNRAHCDLLPCVLRLAVFDCAVNSGVHASIKLLQSALGVGNDGVFGPKTLFAVKECKPDEVLRRLVHLRWTLYTTSTKWSVFGKGWMKRLCDIAIVGALAGKDRAMSEGV